jgi:hypothetical protein
MMTDLLHRFFFSTLVTTVIGTVWVVGWCQAVSAEANRGTWPAIPVPGHVSQITKNSSHADSTQDGMRSLNQVFFKHDQVIRVR